MQNLIRQWLNSELLPKEQKQQKLKSSAFFVGVDADAKCQMAMVEL